MDVRASPAVCERAREWVSLKLDLELSELEASLLRAHLDRCADCAAHAAGVHAVTSELRSAALELPGRPVSVARPRGARMRALQVGAAAAALVAAVALGSVAGRLASPGSIGRSVSSVASAGQVEFEPRLLAFAGLQASATESGKSIAV
jgi:anti-sigma factor RsiW